jgi:hypothetical protein
MGLIGGGAILVITVTKFGLPVLSLKLLLIILLGLLTLLINVRIVMLLLTSDARKEYGIGRFGIEAAAPDTSEKKA